MSRKHFSALYWLDCLIYGQLLADDLYWSRRNEAAVNRAALHERRRAR